MESVVILSLFKMHCLSLDYDYHELHRVTSIKNEEITFLSYIVIYHKNRITYLLLKLNELIIFSKFNTITETLTTNI